MDSERYQKISELFQTVHELPPARRTAFLGQHCLGDDDLRREVESMLAAADTLNNFITSPALEVVSEQIADDELQNAMRAEIGGRIGQYKIVSHLGAGGMGEVWLVEDARLHRQVALKLLSAAQLPDKRDRLQRFEQEARAVSALNHPNIITIFDIGQADGWQFIATEYVAGETLRQRFKEKHTALEAVEIALQIAAALDAAHSAGIAHRDIKPENIMIRADGIVKVLDFGLARFTQKNAFTGDAKTITRPGLVMGTVGYMSPEQARGLTVDERTDIFSLGIVLSEMLTGKTPFQGSNEIEILAAILNQEPIPLPDFVPDALKIVIANALEKDRTERYQTMAEMIADLRRVKRDFEFAGELETRTTNDDLPVFRTNRRSLATGKNESARPTAADFPAVSWFNRHKIAATIIALLIAVAGVGAYSRFIPAKNNKAAAALTDSDKILITDFENKTGDEDFDQILRQPLAVGLAQSPFFSLVSDGQIRQTLKLMDKPTDTALTDEVAREICVRRGIKVFLKGSLENYGVQYLVTLEAFDASADKAIARQQTQVRTKESVLTALNEATVKMRESLGESLASIQKFDAPLKDSTTSSLEALKAYTAAFKKTQSGKSEEAIPLLKRAVELDPNFSAAYAALAVCYYNQGENSQVAEYAEKAFNLRDRATEREKLRLSSFYYAFVTGQIDKDAETLEIYKQTYPRDNLPPANLSDSYIQLGKFDKAAENAKISMELDPTAFVPYTNLGKALVRQSRFDDAQQVFQDGLNHRFENVDFNKGLFTVAFVKNDADEMKRQLEAIKSQPGGDAAFLLAGNPAIFAGRWRDYETLIKQSVAAVEKDSPDIAADYAAQAAVNAAAVARCRDAETWAQSALKFDRDKTILQDAALSYALCGSDNQSLVDELKKRFPKATVSNEIWLPVIFAAGQLQRGEPEKALASLEASRKYEGAANFWEVYLRGQCYLKLNKSDLAIEEFQKIINNRGWAPQSPLYALAYLGAAQAAALQNNQELADRNLETFLTLWKNADRDLTALKEAQIAKRK